MYCSNYLAYEKGRKFLPQPMSAAVASVSKFAINPPPTDSVDYSDEERRDNLAAFLADAPESGPVWVFGAGSLIWQESRFK